MKTKKGSIWNLNKPVRSSLFKGTGILTGKIEYQNVCGEEQCLLEVDWGFGKDFIFEDLLSQ